MKNIHCPICQGKKQVDGKTCINCSGTGLIKTEDDIVVTEYFHKDYDSNNGIIFDSEGDN